jgi:hypothetical protein
MIETITTGGLSREGDYTRTPELWQGIFPFKSARHCISVASIYKNKILCLLQKHEVPVLF